VFVRYVYRVVKRSKCVRSVIEGVGSICGQVGSRGYLPGVGSQSWRGVGEL
jgi:hypothetical protein